MDHPAVRVDGEVEVAVRNLDAVEALAQVEMGDPIMVGPIAVGGDEILKVFLRKTHRRRRLHEVISSDLHEIALASSFGGGGEDEDQERSSEDGDGAR
jgi:hypothetical protein